MKVAVEATVNSELALGHGELLQEPVEEKGVRPVQPDHGQVAVHGEGRHVLGGCRETNTFKLYFTASFNCLAVASGGLNKCVTFAECADGRPVGGSAAHLIEAGSPQLIGRVWLEPCTVKYRNFTVLF